MDESHSIPRRGVRFGSTIVVFLAGWALIAGPSAFGVPSAEEGAESATYEAELASIDRQICTALRGLEPSMAESREARLLLVGDEAGLLDDLSMRLESLEPVVSEELRPKVLALRSLLKTLEHVATGEAVLPPGALGLPEGDEVTWLGGERLAVPPNDACDSAILVGKGSFAGDTSLATNSAAVPCGGSSESPDVWFRYEGTESELVVFDTIGSSFDTVLSLHDSCPPNPSSFVACNDDGFGLQSKVYQNRSPSSGPVWIRVSGFNGASGPFVLTVGNGAVLSGRVTDAATGDPLAGVGVVAELDQDTPIDHATTDAGGRYAIAGLLPAEEVFVLTYGAGEYIAELYDDVVCVTIGCDYASATPLTILNNVITSGVDFGLDLGGGITGTVTRAGTAEPLMDVQVKVFDVQGKARAVSITDESGAYAIGGLATGTYFVVADQYFPYPTPGPPVIAELYDDIACAGGPPQGCDVTTGTPVAVTVRQTTTGIDFVLELEGRVSGTVTESGTGDPVSGLRVEAIESSGLRMAFGYTDGTGHYETQSVESGSYSVVTVSYGRYVDELYDDVPCESGLGYSCEPGDGTPVLVVADTTTTGIDFVLVPRGSIAGTVTEEGSGEPLPFVWAKVWTEGPSTVRSLQTDAAGAYRIDSLYPGTYLVSTGAQHHIDEVYDNITCQNGDLYSCATGLATPVVVADGIVTGGVDFALRRKGAVSGTVTLEASGLPLERVYVNAWKENSYSEESLATTDANGSYTMELFPGTYYFTATDATYSPTVQVEVYDDIPCPYSACDPTQGTPVVVVADSTIGGIDFALQRKGNLSGTVVATTTGAPIPGVRMRLYGSPYYVPDAYTDAAGMYSFDALEAGSYFVSALASGLGFRDELFDDVACSAYSSADLCPLETGAPVVVANESTTAGVDFSLERLGAISGRVTHQSSGAPVSGVRISGYLADGSEVRLALTDEDGRYTLGSLSHGPLYVVAEKSGSFEELWQETPCPGGFPVGCELTAGVAVPVVLNGETTGIDFTLEDKGTIAGRVTDASTGSPLAGAGVRVFDQTGNEVSGSGVDSLGRWTVGDLFEGTYFILTVGPSSSSYVAEIYDDLACSSSCDATKGTPIVISRGSFVGDIDVALEGYAFYPTVLGNVLDAETGDPISGVIVDAWQTPDAYSRSSITSSEGTFELNLRYETTIFLTTDSGFLFVDEVYNDHACSRGAAALGLCDPMKGDPIELQHNAPPVRIDFELRRAALFAGNFESGDLSGWSRAVGGP